MSFVNRIRDIVGLNESVEYDEEYETYDVGTDSYNSYNDAAETGSRRRQRSHTAALEPASTPTSNVIGLPGLSSSSEVVVMEPRSFEEMPQAIQALRERKTIVLNLTMMEPEQAQRAVDFVAGGTFAIDGHQERVGESIFLFTPSCVHVTTQGGEQYLSDTPVAAPVHPTASFGRTATPTPAWATETRYAAQ
ncbi:cell division protein SepF [Synechococcus elongatus IITB7]|uniref:cell division protein SepF n=1 Tax=Synechococcus elongatus TaxID=32046 RepID=UPI0030D463F9